MGLYFANWSASSKPDDISCRGSNDEIIFYPPDPRVECGWLREEEEIIETTKSTSKIFETAVSTTYIRHGRHVNLFKTQITSFDKPCSNKVPPNFD
mmetsp:Transcript_15896/g.26091  ORF Transcript_15896/g.26091 Transcript_15896/m.26091 type:complete len:96 (+) Transcript_15896:95-382(+)